MALGEHVPIISKKSFECLADRGISEGSNIGCSVKFGVVKKYLFKLLYGLCRHPVFFYAHGLEVVIHFHHGHIAFACGHLISVLLSHSIVGRKLNH